MATVEAALATASDHNILDGANPEVTQQDSVQGTLNASTFTEIQPPDNYFRQDDKLQRRPTLSRQSSYQRPVSMSSSKPRKFNKRSRSGSRTMQLLSSSTAPRSSSKPRRRRKPKKHHADHSRTASSPATSSSSKNNPFDRSKSKSPALYRTPRRDQNDRIRRNARLDEPTKERVRSLVSPSLLSVLSALTSTTGSSSGSNVTVKPHSSSRRSSSPRGASVVHNHPSWNDLEASKVVEVLQSKSEETSPEVDVFDFLEQDAPAHSSWSNHRPGPSVQFAPEAIDLDTLSIHSAPPSTIEPSVELPLPIGNDCNTPTGNSFLSDSGISVGGDSPEVKRQSFRHIHHASVRSVPEEPERSIVGEDEIQHANLKPNGAKPSMNVDRGVKTPPINTDLERRWMHQNSSAFGYGLYESFPGMSQPRKDSAYPMHSALSALPSASADSNLLGYELLASKLSAFAGHTNGNANLLVPLYRRFEALNHRVLLHLQDEICELEEQLRIVEECISQTQHDVDGLQRRGSRREDAHSRESLRYQRTDLLGRICMKLNTYSQALESYRSAVDNNEVAQEDDIAKYKDWMDQARPITRTERHFLDHKLDLISISSRSKPLKPHLQSHEYPKEDAIDAFQGSHVHGTKKKAIASRWLKVGAPGAMLLTFISFSVVPNFWARILMMLLFAGIGYASLHLSELDLEFSSQELRYCVVVYVSIMATLAGTFT